MAALLLVLVLAGHTFVAIGWLRPVLVAGDSMSPTYEDGHRLLVARWAEPQRWDVVLLRCPTDARRLIVKRVVGLPGEEITFRGGAVWADGQRRNPPHGLGVYYGATGNPVWRLRAGEYLVVGDNQPRSIDGRNWPHSPGAPRRLFVGVVR